MEAAVFRVISQVSLTAQASTEEETGCNPYWCHQLVYCIPGAQKSSILIRC